MFCLVFPLIFCLLFLGNNQYIPASDADIYSTKSNSTLWQSSLSQSSSDSNTRPTPPVTPNNGIVTTTPTSHTRRNMGGRKPTKDLNISPEEEERRRVRRERNKLAAARCRKRRVDHTNALIEVGFFRVSRTDVCELFAFFFCCRKQNR